MKQQQPGFESPELDEITLFDPNQKATPKQQSRLAKLAEDLHKRMVTFMGYDKQKLSKSDIIDFRENGDVIEVSAVVINDPQATESKKELAMARIHKALGETYNVFAEGAKAAGGVSMDLVNLVRAESNNVGHELAKLCRLAYRNCEDYIAKKREFAVDQVARDNADIAHNKGAADFNPKGDQGRMHLGMFAEKIGSAAKDLKTKAEKLIADRNKPKTKELE